MVRISVELPEEMAEALARAADDLQSTREAVLLQAARGFLTDLEMSRESGDFAAFAAAVGAEGVVVKALADLDRLDSWTQEDAATRRFLLLDLRISGDVIAPYQQEIIRVNS